MAKFAIIIFIAVAITGCLASNFACPHPQQANHLIFEQRVQAGPPDSGRQIAEIEVPAQVIRDQPISCVTFFANEPGSTPDILGVGSNREGGLSAKLHSRERSPLDVSMFIYVP